MAEKQKYTILVVEDVDEISANMVAALNKRGHRVAQASNAEEAIELAEKNPPAIILTDSDLPTFDKLLELAHSHASLKDTVIAIIDINHLQLTDPSVRVVPDFEALEGLLESPH